MSKNGVAMNSGVYPQDPYLLTHQHETLKSLKQADEIKKNEGTQKYEKVYETLHED
jgi:hypothetical protein